MAEHFHRDLLADLIAAHFSAKREDLAFTRSTTGKFNTTYFVEGLDRPLVLRIAPPDDAGYVFYEKGMMAQEPGIHKLVRERTSVPVAEIIAYDTSRRHVDRDYLIMEHLPGTALSHFRASPVQLRNVLRQTGAFLRQVHGTTADKYGYLGEHQCMEPLDDWLSAFTVMWDKMAEDVAGAGYYDSEEEKWMKDLLGAHAGEFDRPVTSRLLHMDIWAQNILVDENADVTGLLDWDRALWGDKEIEFAVLDYCGISESAFWAGYGEYRDTSPEAQVRRAFYLAYEVQKYIVIRHYRHRDTAAAKAYKDQSLSILRNCQSGVSI